MGWSSPWVSAATTDFNCDSGVAATQEQVHDRGLDKGGQPPNAATTGTDIPGYLSQSRAVSVFTLADGAVDPQPDGRLECGLWPADHVARPHGWPC